MAYDTYDADGTLVTHIQTPEVGYAVAFEQWIRDDDARVAREGANQEGAS